MPHDPVRTAFELREQLASDKRRLGFFFGAGTSMAVGVPGIDQLTTDVETALAEPCKAHFMRLLKGLTGDPNVEDVLNQVRLYRELIEKSTANEFDGLDADAAAILDRAICTAIHSIVAADPPRGLTPHQTFAHWLHTTHRSRGYPVEIFTTNYDLLLERTMEQVGVPFFDGFVGSVAPFFVPESVEADGSSGTEDVLPPMSWTRLWKLHGSIGWQLQKDEGSDRARITRLAGLPSQAGDELMIFPSREKYADSRRLPFLTYQDRLRRFLSRGEAVLFMVGYRFSDAHINEIILQALRSNSRLAVTVLTFGIESGSGLTVSEDLIKIGESHRNIGIYGPDMAVIGGIQERWSEPSSAAPDGQEWPFWDSKSKNFTLGDFNAFSKYLDRFIGIRSLTDKTPGSTTPESTA